MGNRRRDLRLLYAIDSLAPGGAESSLAALAPAYRLLGVDMTIVVLAERGGLTDQIRAASTDVIAIGGRSRVAQLQTLVQQVKQQRPDLVHTTLFEADILGRVAARSARTPVVSSLVTESYGPEHAGEAGVRVSRLLLAHAVDATTARLAVRLHAVSEQVKHVMSRRLRYPIDRIDVVPRGRDPGVLGRRTQSRRSATRRALGLGDNDPILICVARHEPPKSLEQVVTALSDVRRSEPSARLLIAGREGNATAALQRAVRANGLEGAVTLLGARPDVPDLLCAADVFVLASRREGMPGSVIEAMALEVPIVATDLPQVREATGLHGAVLVPAGDTRALATAITTCLAGVGTAARVAESRRRFEERFTINTTARLMVDLYERALAR